MSSGEPPDPGLGKLSHRMNNALAYVLTNLNVVVEELETAPGLPPDQRRRLLRLLDDATQGSGRLGELIRELQATAHVVNDPTPDNSEDTWDVEGAAARILVIDDEEAILSSLKLALRRYDVHAESDPRAAIARIEAGERFDLVLCDLVMPGMSGMDVYKALQRVRRDLLPRMIFMTGGAFTAELRAFLGSIRNTVLHKPFDTKTLRWLVAQQLNRAGAAPS